jgi:hypothetical protein
MIADNFSASSDNLSAHLKYQKEILNNSNFHPPSERHYSNELVKVAIRILKKADQPLITDDDLKYSLEAACNALQNVFMNNQFEIDALRNQMYYRENQKLIDYALKTMTSDEILKQAMNVICQRLEAADTEFNQQISGPKPKLGSKDKGEIPDLLVGHH